MRNVTTTAPNRACCRQQAPHQFPPVLHQQRTMKVLVLLGLVVAAGANEPQCVKGGRKQYGETDVIFARSAGTIWWMSPLICFIRFGDQFKVLGIMYDKRM